MILVYGNFVTVMAENNEITCDMTMQKVKNIG